MPRAASPRSPAALLALSAATSLALAAAPAPTLAQGAAPAAEAPASALPDETPARIEVAFVLDTTGSMTGLIEGAKRKIWSIASELLETEEQATVRFGLIGYRDRGDQYVTIQTALTEDINGVYGDLLGYQAAGGGDRPESVNQALNEAVTQFGWSQDENVLRMVFLVGDSPPKDYDDDVDYDVTCERARERDIVVNTVLAGTASDTRGIWKAIAQLCDGDYMEIPQDGGMQQIATPYDEQLNQLQRQINATVTPYGAREAQEYIAAQRSLAASAADEVASDMAAVRMKGGKANRVVSGGATRLDGGDLVEDYEDGAVDLDALSEDELPETYKAMTPDERRAAVEAKVAERGALNDQMADLVAERDAWLAEKMAEAENAETDAFDLKVRESVRSAAAERGIRYKTE